MKHRVLFLAALLLAACNAPPDDHYTGYVEAEYSHVSAAFSGTLTKVSVKRGDRVVRDAPLFELDRDSESLSRQEAQARLERARAQLENLKKGRRPAEIDALRAQLVQAQAILAASSAQLARDQSLVEKNFIAASRLDDTRAQATRDAARVREIEAQLAVAKLPARADEIAAAQAEVAAAQKALDQGEWREAQKIKRAPVDAQVIDVLYREGEWVPAGAPVISLLSPAKLKVRFFVPQADLARLPLGTEIRVSCDGCAAPIAARVNFIAPQAEFTPPVIYSRESRAKLVFLVEAAPADAAVATLKPGQPVDVAKPKS